MAEIQIRYSTVSNYEPKAARVADLLKSTLRVDTDVVPGEAGEFSVWVRGVQVARKGLLGLPSDRRVVGAVGLALTLPPPPSPRN